MMLCAEKGNVLDALPTAFIVDIEAKRVNEMINDVSEKQLTKSILEGSASVSKFLREHHGMDKKYDLIKADSNTANGILNKSITTYSQMLDSIYESTYEENNYSILYKVDSEYLNVRAIMENKSAN